MAEGGADLGCSHGCIYPDGRVETGLCGEAGAHTVLAHVTAAFMETTRADEDGFGAPVEAGAANVAERGAGEASIGGGMDGPGALEAEWLKHTCVVVDCERVVASQVAELVENVQR